MAGVLSRWHLGVTEGSNSPGKPILLVVAVYTRAATPVDIAHFRDTSVIYGIELFTLVAVIFLTRYRLEGTMSRFTRTTMLLSRR